MSVVLTPVINLRTPRFVGYFITQSKYVKKYYRQKYLLFLETVEMKYIKQSMLSWIIYNLLIFAWYYMIQIVMVYGKFLIICFQCNTVVFFISAKVHIWDMVVMLCVLPLCCVCGITCNISMQSAMNDWVRVIINLHREVYHTDTPQETFECLPFCIWILS